MSRIQVYRSGRLKSLLAVSFFAALAGGSFLMADDKPLVGWAMVLLFAGCTVFSLVTLATGGVTLTLGRKGFEIASWLKCQRVRWDEIEPVRLGQIRSAKILAVSYLPGNAKSGVSRAMMGMDVSIPNQFGVPLQQLCDEMNQFREDYLAAHPAARAAWLGRDSAPVAVAAGRPAQDTRRPRVVLLAFGAALLVGVLNIVLRLVLKWHGTSLTLGIAFTAAGLAMLWFLKVLQRAPTPRERVIFLGVYSALVLLPYIALYASVVARQGFHVLGLLVVTLHAVAYPATAQMLLSEKRFSALRPARA
jgi:hypothetical protein